MSAPHLHDDDLSASLDGYGLDADADAHLAACPECRARLDALAAAAAALATTVPAPPGLRDAAVARAVAAADEPVSSASPRARRPAPWLAAAAAAVVVVLGVSFAVRTGDGGEDAATTAASNALDGGDLGELDAASLHERVRPLLEPAAVADDSGAGGGGAESGAESGEPDDAGGDSAVKGAPSMALRQANGPTPSTAACEAIVDERYSKGLAGPLVYRATGTWQGKDAFVLAYRIAEPRGQLDHILYVVAQRDCELLNVQSF